MRLTRSPLSGLVTSARFDAFGSGTPLNDSFGYNPYGELTSYSVKDDSGANFYSYQITRDDLGRISSKSETLQSVTHVYGYTYDVRGRLTKVLQDGVATSGYNYDSNGNRVSATRPTGSQTFAYDNLDQLISHGSISYTYNANGQRASQTNSTTNQTTSYTYDVFGNLVGVTLPDGRMINYVLDGENRRVGKKIDGVLTESYTYLDHLRLAARSIRGVGSQIYAYPNRQNVPEVVFYFPANVRGSFIYRVMADERGTPRLVEDGISGNIIEQITTDEFGNILNDTNPGAIPFGFAGCLYDQDTKLCHFGARDYDPEVGRWLTRDPIGFRGGDTNLYGYVLNDPINGFDPQGLWTIQVGGSASAIAIFGHSLGAGFYIGTTRSGLLDIGLYGSTSTGAGLNVGAGFQATVSSGNVEDIAGETTDVSIGAGALFGSRNHPSCGGPNSYSFGLGVGAKYGVSGSITNTGTIGLSNIPSGDVNTAPYTQ